MADLVILLKVVGIFVYLVMGVIGWTSFVGMHNNTIDGNSFRLLYPLCIFDKGQFTEEGNNWRRIHVKLWLFSLILAIGFWYFI